MKFTFDYKEILSRRITIEASSFLSAAEILREKLDDGEIILNSEDFTGAEITMPLCENFLPQLRDSGEDVEDKGNFDILIDFW
jgi:hypothetical protein